MPFWVLPAVGRLKGHSPEISGVTRQVGDQCLAASSGCRPNISPAGELRKYFLWRAGEHNAEYGEAGVTKRDHDAVVATVSYSARECSPYFSSGMYSLRPIATPSASFLLYSSSA